VTESGLFPGVVYYLSMWYKRNERQYRISLFFSCASLAGAFGGILAWGIAHMRNVGGYSGWRWIFILVSRLKTSLFCADSRNRKAYSLSSLLSLHIGLSRTTQIPSHGSRKTSAPSSRLASGLTVTTPTTSSFDGLMYGLRAKTLKCGFMDFASTP
jgi:hypothetical protein